MSLWDIDKNTNNRREPTLNQNDKLIQRKSNNTLSTVPVTATNTPVSRIAFKKNVILYYDDQNRVIRVDGFIPVLASYPVSITAVYGYDVYVDILGLIAPVV